MDSSIINAINAASKKAIKIEQTPEPPKENKSEIHICCNEEYYEKPCLRLNSKDFSGVKDFKGGEKVTLVIDCLVENTEYSESTNDDGEKKERSSARLEIQQIADITPYVKSEFLKKK